MQKVPKHVQHSQDPRGAVRTARRSPTARQRPHASCALLTAPPAADGPAAPERQPGSVPHRARPASQGLRLLARRKSGRAGGDHRVSGRLGGGTQLHIRLQAQPCGGTAPRRRLLLPSTQRTAFSPRKTGSKTRGLRFLTRSAVNAPPPPPGESALNCEPPGHPARPLECSGPARGLGRSLGPGRLQLAPAPSLRAENTPFFSCFATFKSTSRWPFLKHSTCLRCDGSRADHGGGRFLLPAPHKVGRPRRTGNRRVRNAGPPVTLAKIRYERKTKAGNDSSSHVSLPELYLIRLVFEECTNSFTWFKIELGDNS